MKKCKDCKWSAPLSLSSWLWHGERYSECTNPEIHLNGINGINFCRMARCDEYLCNEEEKTHWCGEEARFFEQKESWWKRIVGG